MTPPTETTMTEEKWLPLPEPGPFVIIIALIHLVISSVIVMIEFFKMGIGLPCYGIPLASIIFMIGIFYERYPGRRWYEEKLIPHILKTQMFTQNETDRFISFTRLNKILFLVLSWLFAIMYETLLVVIFDVPDPLAISISFAYYTVTGVLLLSLFMGIPVLIAISIVALHTSKKRYMDIKDVIRAAQGNILRGIG